MPGFKRRLIVSGEAYPRRHPLEGDVMKGSTFVPVTFCHRGQRKVAIAPVGVDTPITTAARTPVLPTLHDPTLLKALGKGFYWQHLIDAGKVADASEIAKCEGVHRATVNELLRLALLAPEIIESALAGRLPQTVTLEGLLKAALPRGWGEQWSDISPSTLPRHKRTSHSHPQGGSPSGQG